MRFLLISCRASLRRNYHDEVMIWNSSDSGHEVSAEGRRSPDDRISRRPKGGGITFLRRNYHDEVMIRNSSDDKPPTEGRGHSIFTRRI